VDKNVGVVPKGRRSNGSPNCMPINGDHVTMEIFVKHGWWSNNKLSCSSTSVACYHLVMLGLLAHVN
jgi:hypothetical protein